jgi:hypothetical protein
MHLLVLSVSRILKEVKLPKHAKINQDSHWSAQTHIFGHATDSAGCDAWTRVFRGQQKRLAASLRIDQCALQ